MDVSRKRFLQSLAGGTAVLLFQGCGGGGSDYGGGPAPAPAPPAAGCSASTITVNHGHALTIARADLDSATDKVYSIAGTAGHDHTVTLTPAMLATLKSGMAVTVTSSNNLSHMHDVTITCV
jgi:hypothetical protein